MTLAERIGQLIEKYGSLRAAARVVEIDSSYLLRLGSGEKVNPSTATLRRLGLHKVVVYELIWKKS